MVVRRATGGVKSAIWALESTTDFPPSRSWTQIGAPTAVMNRNDPVHLGPKRREWRNRLARPLVAVRAGFQRLDDHEVPARTDDLRVRPARKLSEVAPAHAGGQGQHGHRSVIFGPPP